MNAKTLTETAARLWRERRFALLSIVALFILVLVAHHLSISRLVVQLQGSIPPGFAARLAALEAGLIVAASVVFWLLVRLKSDTAERPNYAAMISRLLEERAKPHSFLLESWTPAVSPRATSAAQTRETVPPIASGLVQPEVAPAGLGVLQFADADTSNGIRQRTGVAPIVLAATAEIAARATGFAERVELSGRLSPDTEADGWGEVLAFVRRIELESLLIFGAAVEDFEPVHRRFGLRDAVGSTVNQIFGAEGQRQRPLVLVRDDVPEVVRGDSDSFKRLLQFSLAVARTTCRRSLMVLVGTQNRESGPVVTLEIREDEASARMVESAAPPVSDAMFDCAILVAERVGGALEWLPDQRTPVLRLTFPVERRVSDDDSTAEYALSEIVELRTSEPEKAVTETQAALANPDLSRPRNRVLLVESDSIARWTITAQLAEFGYVTDAVGSGDQAIDAVSERRYTAVLVDAELASPNAYETAARIRARLQKGVPPLILGLCTELSAVQERRCRAAGMDGCFRKPVDAHQLVEQLAAAAAGIVQSAERAAVSPAPAPEGQALVAVAVDLRIIEQLQRLGSVTAQPNLVERLIRGFRERAASAFVEFEQAVAAADVQRVNEIAAGLKRSCAVLGLARMEAVIDELTRASDLNEVAALVGGLHSEFGRVQPILESREKSLS